jgi:predicted small secreted protein
MTETDLTNRLKIEGKDMMKKQIALVFVMIAMAFGLTACNESDAEEVGENIDQAINDAGNSVEDLCERAKEGLELKDQDC